MSMGWLTDQVHQWGRHVGRLVPPGFIECPARFVTAQPWIKIYGVDPFIADRLIFSLFSIEP